MFLKIEIYNCHFIVSWPHFHLPGKVKSNAFLLKKGFSYAFSGFSIIFVVYILINIFNNYPPRLIGISP